MTDVTSLKNDLYDVLNKHGVSLQVNTHEVAIGIHEEFVAVDSSGAVVAVLNPNHGFVSAKQLSS